MSILDLFTHHFTLDVLTQPSYAEFARQYLHKRQPVIIKGAVSHWPACQKWNLDYLQQKIGDNRFTLTRHHSAVYNWHMSDYLEKLQQEPNASEPLPYLTNANIAEHFPQLIKDILPYCPYGLPDWKCSRYLPKHLHYTNYQVELLLGSPGSQFFLHQDRGCINAFVAQIVGHKELILLPPQEQPFLYQDQTGKPQVDIWQPDFTAYPLLRQARVAQYTLEPGDMIYIPANWWHAVRNTTLSMAVTFNSINRGNWADFSRFIAQRIAQQSGRPAKAWLTYAYLRLLGAGFRAYEALTPLTPNTGNLKQTWHD